MLLHILLLQVRRSQILLKKVGICDLSYYPYSYYYDISAFILLPSSSLSSHASLISSVISTLAKVAFLDIGYKALTNSFSKLLTQTSIRKSPPLSVFDALFSIMIGIIPFLNTISSNVNFI